VRALNILCAFYTSQFVCAKYSACILHKPIWMCKKYIVCSLLNRCVQITNSHFRDPSSMELLLSFVVEQLFDVQIEKCITFFHHGTTSINRVSPKLVVRSFRFKNSRKSVTQHPNFEPIGCPIFSYVTRSDKTHHRTLCLKPLHANQRPVSGRNQLHQIWC